MNNKTILLLNSAFASSEELWRSWRMLSSKANTLLDLHNSSDDTQPHLKIVNRPLAPRGHVTNASFKQ